MSGPTAGQTSSVTADEEAEQKTALLDASVEGTVIEEAVPASRRRRPRQHGDRPLLEVNGLKTSFYTRDGVVRAVDGINFHVDSGEIMGLVGESGCGKSVTSLSILRLVANPGRIEGGEVLFDGTDLLKLPDGDMRKIRGDRISMIFQQPTVVAEPGLGRRQPDRGGPPDPPRHERQGRPVAGRRPAPKMVGIPDPERRLKAYPHEMSGGMAQRVMIAMALACEPELLIADEPTTALDVTIQAQILDLMRHLRDELGTAIVLITHDLGVVAEMCDRVAVMYAGEIVEETDVDVALPRPEAPVHARPDRVDPGRRRARSTSSRSSPAASRTSSTCRPAAGSRRAAWPGSRPTSRSPRSATPTCCRCRPATTCAAGCTTTRPATLIPEEQRAPVARQVRRMSAAEAPVTAGPAGGGAPASAAASPRRRSSRSSTSSSTSRSRPAILQRTGAWVQAVDHVSFEVRKGETLGLVGESGCGKTTVGRLILRLLDPTSRHDPVRRRRHHDAQGIGAASPTAAGCRSSSRTRTRRSTRATPIGDSIGEGLRIHGLGSAPERRAKVARMMDLVGLQPYHARRYPHEFSGGQRQRIGIARALVLEPDLIICDEPVSALDVSIQAQVLNLLKSLQRELGLTYVFVAHNMGVVEHISDRVAVMYLGKVVELADRRDLFRKQEHPYTEALMSAIPVPEPRAPPPADHPQGRRPLAAAPTVRLPVPSPVPAPGVARQPRDLRDRRAAARGVRRRPLLCLPLPWGERPGGRRQRRLT